MVKQRIKELFKQSYDELNEPTNDPIAREWLMKELLPEYQRFAELIILECVNAVMDGTKEGDHYAQKIEQHFDNSTGGILHFGVEE